MKYAYAALDTKNSNIHIFMSLFYNRFYSMKFTFEIVNKQQLPLLNVLIIGECINKLEFDISRKNTFILVDNTRLLD